MPPMPPRLTNKEHNDKIVLSIPAFDGRGNLPPGVHWATWGQLNKRFGLTMHRRLLLEGLHEALLELKAAGCRVVYIDGSFVTEKEHPADFDACWDSFGVDPDKLQGSALLRFKNGRALQKAKYGGDIFIANTRADATGALYLDFFQSDRDGFAKGIIAIDLRRFRG